MRNRDGLSARSETRSLAVPVLRSGLPLQLTAKLPSWQLLEQDWVCSFPEAFTSETPAEPEEVRDAWKWLRGGRGSAAARKYPHPVQ